MQKYLETIQIEEFQDYMSRNEKAQATIEKYVREIKELKKFMKDREIKKEILLEYRQYLCRHNCMQTVNGKLSAINSFLDFLNLHEYKLKYFHVQRKAFVEENRELSETEYKRLLTAARAKGSSRLYHLMITIAGTGIRVSELRFITLEAVAKGKAEIYLKGKSRVILLQKELRKKLLKYANMCGIQSGYIFRTKNNKPLDRSNICHDMKRLCEAASVEADKVFPHNFRHLFARSFYAVEKNLAHLADILGHSSIETTRIYVAVSARAYEETLSRMNLIL